MKCNKKILSQLYYSISTVILSVCIVILGIISPMSSIGSYCVTTPSGQPDFTQADSYSVLEDIDWRKLASTAFKLKGIISPSLVGTASGFIEYDLNNNNSLQAHPTIGIRNNSDGTKTYDIPKEIRQEIFNYINTNVQANPLSYVECTIQSINFIDVSQFQSYAQYQSVKGLAEQNKGCWIFLRRSYSHPNYVYRVAIVPINGQMFFFGTQSQGLFTSVNVGYDWQQNNTPWRNISGSKQYQVQVNGSVSEVGVNTDNYVSAQGTMNTTSVYYTEHGSTVFTTNEKSQKIYLFNNINAFKNYNSGSPQPYYLRSNWQDIVDDNNYIGSDELDRYGKSYSEVTNNVVSGMTAEQVIQLVDTILKNTSGGSSSDSDKDTSKWWERIGNAIGNLIDGIVDVLTKVIEKLSDALLSIIHLLTGYTDDNGTYHAGLFDKLTDLVDSGFSSFISSMFSWLPDEIVTLLTATLVFGIFFGIFKMLRR